MKHSSTIPRLIFWELTKRCNLQCKHCRAEADDVPDSNEMNTIQVKKVLDNIKSFSDPILVLTGGEPLFRKDIFDIASYARGKGVRLALATNGTLIDKSIAKRIKESGFQRVSISIDGATEGSHDGFRGIPGAFRKAESGAAYLRKVKVPFQINTTITRRNVHEIEGILKLAEEWGAVALHLFMLVPVGCGIEIAETDMISREKYEEVLLWFYHRVKEVKLEFKATCAPHYYRIIRQEASRNGTECNFTQNGMAAVTRGCLAGSGVCFISNSGDVQPCGYLPLIAGNVLKEPFESIWKHSELFNKLRDLDNLEGKCGICEFKNVCAGCRARAFYASGNCFAEEPCCIYEPEYKPVARE